MTIRAFFVYSVIYHSGSVPRKAIFSPLETSPESITRRHAQHRSSVFHQLPAIICHSNRRDACFEQVKTACACWRFSLDPSSPELQGTPLPAGTECGRFDAKGEQITLCDRRSQKNEGMAGPTYSTHLGFWVRFLSFPVSEKEWMVNEERPRTKIHVQH